MELSSLSNREIVCGLGSAVTKERKMTVEVLEYLAEMDKRALHRELGYTSLFEYCTKVLKLSEGSACRRITSARCLRDNPELKGMIEKGEVSLCSLTTAAKSLESKVTTIQEIAGCLKREVEAIVAKVSPEVSKPREIVKPFAVKVPEQSERTTETPPVQERVEIRFSLSKEEYQRLEEAKRRLSNSLGEDLSVEGVIGKLLERFLKPVKPSSSETVPVGDGRYIPKALERAVFERDERQCTYFTPEGKRCEGKAFLQIDHVRPLSAGGKTELANLRLLCSCHHRLVTEDYFGKGFVGQFTATGGGNFVGDPTSPVK